MPASFLAHCSPSSTQSAPLLPLLSAQYPPLYSQRALLCAPLSLSHTRPPTLTHSFTAQRISTRTRKLCRLFNEGRDGDKGPSCPCLQFNRNRKENSELHTHTGGYSNGEHWSSLAHCYEQSCICKSNKGCTEWAAPPAEFAQTHIRIKAGINTVNTYKYVCPTELYVRHPHTVRSLSHAKTRLLDVSHQRLNHSYKRVT